MVDLFQGSRYRFRLINAEFLNCPIEVSIDNHTLYVVSTDGYDIEPIEGKNRIQFIHFCEIYVRKRLCEKWISLITICDL